MCLSLNSIIRLTIAACLLLTATSMRAELVRIREPAESKPSSVRIDSKKNRDQEMEPSSPGEGAEPFSLEKHFDLFFENKSAEDVYKTAQVFEAAGSNLAPHHYRYAAKKWGHVPSLYALGALYYAGRIVKQSDEKAFEWFLKAAEAGDAKAQNDVGALYLQGRGTRKDVENGFEWVQKAAEQGNVPAMNNLGRIYLEGIGRKADEKEAMRWFLKSADQGNADAKMLIAEMHEKGKGVKRDFKELTAWYVSAAKDGHPDAKNNAAVWLTLLNQAQSTPDVLQYLHEAAEAGNAAAQMNLANRYYNGNGVEKNLKEAFKWYLRVAKNPASGILRKEAMWNIAVMYRNGEGTQKDLVQAMEWYEKAALEGDMEAAFALGNLYYEKANEGGEDAAQNLDQAERWYQMAAEAHHPQAQFNLGCLYFQKGPKQDLKKALQWYHMAVAHDVSEAQANLGMMFLTGCGVRRDVREGVKWIKKAADQGNVEALYNLSMLHLNGLTDKQDPVQALKLAENGNARSLYERGLSYLFEQTLVPKDRSKAVELLKQAAEKGHSDAQKVLAQIGYSSEGKPPWR